MDCVAGQIYFHKLGDPQEKDTLIMKVRTEYCVCYQELKHWSEWERVCSNTIGS